jgi:AcrR family transcriptional regulator
MYIFPIRNIVIMARRLLINIDERIIDAVMDIGANEGIAKISAPKVAKMCEISHFTCFDHFGTKENMLKQAAIAFENKYMGVLMNHMSTHRDVEELWLTMLDELSKDANGTLYYLNYTSAYGFKPTPQNINFETYKGALIKAIGGEIGEFSDAMYMLTWDYLSTNCFFYARYIIRKQMPDSPEVRKFVKDLVFQGVHNIFKTYKKD